MVSGLRRTSETQPQLVNTAPVQRSIWRDVSRNTFRQHAVALRRVAEIAGDERVHSPNHLQLSRTTNVTILPFDVEQRLADDLAFLAAAEDNLRVVSAVALEQYLEPCMLIVRLAANEYIPEAVLEMFDDMFELLGRCARDRRFSRENCARALFNHVMRASQGRIWSRLQPASRDIPIGLAGKTHRPLHQEILDLASALEQQPPLEDQCSPPVLQQLKELQKAMQTFSDYPRRSAEVPALLKDIVLDSHKLGTSNGANSLEDYLHDHSSVIEEARYLLCIRQIDKIGRYWGLCRSTTEDSRKYAKLFVDVKLEILRPYKPATSLITGGGARRAHLHVHAEMQVLTFYGLQSSSKIPKPRAIGVSRAACYLCNLFIQNHGEYFVTKTHGWLFDAWNFPNLAETEISQQDRYRQTIVIMDEQMRITLRRELMNTRKRQNPVGSRLALPLPSLSSPVPSTLLSDVPEENAPEMPRTMSHLEKFPLKTDEIEASEPRVLQSVSADQLDSADALSKSPSLAHSSSRMSTAHSTVRLRSALSLSTDASWEYSIQRAISASSPFRTKIGQTVMEFEIENPAHGRISVVPTDDSTMPCATFAVDVGGMKSGESWTFDRKDGEPSVSLLLQRSNGRSTKLTLQWL